MTTFLPAVSPLPPSGLNPNLNVPLDMGGGGAVSYKEPPQSRLKKLWATDPLEQNSKPGTYPPASMIRSYWFSCKPSSLNDAR